MEKYVLVTGASSGLGKETALTLANKGFMVFAGVRKENDKKIVEALNENIKAVFLDVTDQNSVDAAFETITKITDRLSGLVNNAGIALAAPVECLDIEVIKSQFEVNVYGAIRTAQKFLPLLEHGRIINISSMASFGIFPFVSPYCASKRALDIFFNALSLECKMPDLKIISIKPGVVKTNIWNRSVCACEKIFENTNEKFHKKYEKEYKFLIENARKNNEKGIEPSKIANLVYKALTAKNPSLSYCAGTDANLARLFSMLPLKWVNFFTREIMKKRFK